MPLIRPLDVNNIAGVERAVQIIRESHLPVAQRLNFTKKNSPAYPAYIPARQLFSALKASRVYGYALYEQDEMIGFYMLRLLGGGETCDISRLSVLPQYQRMGYGSQMLENAGELALYLHVDTLHASIVDEHAELKEWLKKRGFTVTSRIKYPQAVYTMCIMEKSL